MFGESTDDLRSVAGLYDCASIDACFELLRRAGGEAGRKTIG
jgi:hypothetical protein